MQLSEVDVLLQPLGETPGVLEPPIASYKPQIIVLIAGKQEDINLAKEHLEGWANHVRNPKIIEKIVEEPWTESTLVRYMKAFDEAEQQWKEPVIADIIEEKLPEEPAQEVPEEIVEEPTLDSAQRTLF